MEKWLKEAMYCSVSAALMPFAGTTEQGLLQSISGYCSYLSVMPLQLIAVLASFYCLSPCEPTRTVQSTKPGRQGTQQPVTTTRCASSIPRRQEPQHHHDLNTNQTARLNLPACFWATVSFITQTLDTYSLQQCSSRAEPTLRYRRSRAFRARWQVLSLCDAFAEEVPLLRWPGPVPAMCSAVFPLRCHLASSLKN